MYRINSPISNIHGGNRSEAAAYALIQERLEKLQLRIDTLLTEYEETKEALISQIQSIKDPLSAQLLYKHYVEDKLLRQIADEMAYDYDYIRALHSKAIQAFSATIEK